MEFLQRFKEVFLFIGRSLRSFASGVLYRPRLSRKKAQSQSRPRQSCLAGSRKTQKTDRFVFAYRARDELTSAISFLPVIHIERNVSMNRMDTHCRDSKSPGDRVTFYRVARGTSSPKVSRPLSQWRRPNTSASALTLTKSRCESAPTRYISRCSHRGARQEEGKDNPVNLQVP